MTDEQKQEMIRDRAADLIKDGTVLYVIGWRKTRFPDKTAVFFARNAEDARDLVWNEYTVPLTAKYLYDDRWPDGKIGVLARGCDSKAINRMLHDNQIVRDNLYIIGLPCDGKAGDRCLSCQRKEPVVYDELLWEPEAEPKGMTERSRFFRADEVDAMSVGDRYGYWEDVYARCIRCYACRNICPVCTCRECYVDMHRDRFQEKRHDTAENRVFGVTRAFHVGDRCIECGECERACPMDLPILGQTQKIIETVDALSGGYESGLDATDESFLGEFCLDDKDGFI